MLLVEFSKRTSCKFLGCLATVKGQAWGTSTLMHLVVLAAMAHLAIGVIEPPKLGGDREVVTIQLTQFTPAEHAPPTPEIEVPLPETVADAVVPGYEPLIHAELAPQTSPLEVPVDVTPRRATVDRTTYVRVTDSERMLRDDLAAVLATEPNPPVEQQRRAVKASRPQTRPDTRVAAVTRPTPRPLDAVREVVPQPAPVVDLAGNDETIKPRAIRARPPLYPEGRRRYSATVRLRLQVSATGEVTKVEIVQSSGYGILDAAAHRAVRDWLFEPARRSGEAVPYTLTAKINFRP